MFFFLKRKQFFIFHSTIFALLISKQSQVEKSYTG